MLGSLLLLFLLMRSFTCKAASSLAATSNLEAGLFRKFLQHQRDAQEGLEQVINFASSQLAFDNNGQLPLNAGSKEQLRSSSGSKQHPPLSGGSNDGQLQFSGDSKEQLPSSGGSKEQLPFSMDSSDRFSLSRGGKKQVQFGGDRSELPQFTGGNIEHLQKSMSSSKEQSTKENMNPSFTGGYDDLLSRRVVSGPDAGGGSHRLDSLADSTARQDGGLKTVADLVGSQAASGDSPLIGSSNFRRHRHLADSHRPEMDLSNPGSLLSKLAKGGFFLIFCFYES
jgi:hypothetical protein